MQGLSAKAEAMLYCTQASFSSCVVSCELQPFPEHRKLCSTDEPMRGILTSWLGGAAIALFRWRWWCSCASCRANLRTCAAVSS